MFSIGDYVVYGTNGVCRVDAVCPSPLDKKDTRLYYALKPLRGTGQAVIYTPVENNRVPIRPIIEKNEVEAIFERILEIPCLSVSVEKQRREVYRTALVSTEIEAYISLLKTIYNRRRELSSMQRRLPDFETEYDMQARRNLYAELSVVLNLPFEGIESYICERAEKARADA
jgi:CarD family transcriptional regulator